MNEIKISEIFGPTIQGEGPNAGARCIFVRVKGCDFACDFCDSKFTWNQNEDNWKSYRSDVLSVYLTEICRRTNCRRIVLTGGNPCLHDFTSVLAALRREGIVVDVETQGSIFPEWLSQIDTIVFSPKPPSSGMPDTYLKIIGYVTDKLSDTNKTIAIKIPVFNQEDVEFARKYAKFVNDFNSCFDAEVKHLLKMYLSVGNSDVDTNESIRDRVLADYERLLDEINRNPKDFENVYILPQIHTLVWGNKQGV